jgi:hypothetical protein
MSRIQTSNKPISLGRPYGYSARLCPSRRCWAMGERAWSTDRESSTTVSGAGAVESRLTREEADGGLDHAFLEKTFARA